MITLNLTVDVISPYAYDLYGKRILMGIFSGSNPNGIWSALVITPGAGGTWLFNGQTEADFDATFMTAGTRITQVGANESGAGWMPMPGGRVLFFFKQIGSSNKPGIMECRNLKADGTGTWT